MRAGLRVEVRAHGPTRDAPAGAVHHGRPARSGRIRRFLSAPFAGARTAGAVVLVVDPELIVPGWLWTRVRRQRLVVDLHEDYHAVSRDRPWTRGLVDALARRLVGVSVWVATRADLTVVADDHVPPLRARRRVVARPQVALHGTARAADREPARDADPRAIYIGDVRPSRGLWAMLEAVAAAPAWRLDVVGNLAEVTDAQVAARLAQLGITDRVTFHGRLPPDRAWKLADGAWCGLALLEDTPAYRAAVPTKIAEYQAAGLPVLSSPLPRVQQVLEASGSGATAGSTPEAAAILRRWGDAPATVAEMGRAGRAWIAHTTAGPDPFDELATQVALLLDKPHAGRAIS